MWILNIYMHFCLCKWNWGTDFNNSILTNFDNSEKLESIVNIFLLFIKISCQSKEFSALSKQPSFSLTPPFLEKIFHPHLYCQIRGTQSPLYKGGGGFELSILGKLFLYLFQSLMWVVIFPMSRSMTETWLCLKYEILQTHAYPFEVARVCPSLSCIEFLWKKKYIWQNMKQMILCFFSKEFSCLLTGENSKSK